MVALDALLDVLQLEEAGENRFQARSLDMGHGVVFGGQLMAQSVVAALHGHEDKLVKTLHTVFARAGTTEAPLDVAVDWMANGRSVASCAVTIGQGGKVCSRSLVMLSADEPDLIRHGDAGPALTPPADGASAENQWVVELVGDVDLSDPDAVGPATLDVWSRFVGAPADPGLSQALLSYATDGFLIGTAMRPHHGVGQSQSHKTLSTGVLSHTLTFHEPFSAADWLLLCHKSPYAGRGRSYGRADVFRPDGEFVASYVQDNMIRAKAPGSSGRL